MPRPGTGAKTGLGLEDIRAFFGEGWHASVEPNFLSDDGVPTAFTVTPQKPVRLNYIQGVVATPAGFGRATRTVFEPGGVRFINGNGAEARALVNHAFLRDMASPAAARDREGPVPPA
jgi:hypothetical protein